MSRSKENNSKINQEIQNNLILNNNKSKNKLYTVFVGGLGNQLFMFFNLLSLSKKYNMDFNVCYDSSYQRHNPSQKYSLFKNIKFNELSKEELKDYEIYNESGFKYNEITFDNKKNNFIKGYFQSYKYFWDYQDEIKKYVYIDNDKINLIKKIFSVYNKKILSIHIRLGDYIDFKDFHYNAPIEYYQNALSKYNLDEYQIILFSDNSKLADEKLKPLNINYIKADDLFSDDEDQFFMLSLSDVKICAASTFSLMSCYLNDIFKFVEDCEYVFPEKWFGPSGPDYNMYDILDFNNEKYKIINSKKCAVIFFHKNIQKLYKKRWVDKCVQSILNQEQINFDIFEINYGNEDYSIFENIELDKKINYSFFKKDYATHTEATTFLLNKLFYDLNYDFVFNTNLDDYYDTKRFYYQYFDLIKGDSLLNSTLFNYITENSDGKDVNSDSGNTFIYSKEHNILTWRMNPEISDCNYNINIPYDVVKDELIKQSNCICHPGVCFTKDFWNSVDDFGNKIRYRNDKPLEDISLWKRSVEAGINIGIVNQNLVHYRIHGSQICSKKKKKK